MIDNINVTELVASITIGGDVIKYESSGQEAPRLVSGIAIAKSLETITTSNTLESRASASIEFYLIP